MATKTKSNNSINSRIAHYQSKGYGRKAAVDKAYGDKKKSSENLPEFKGGGWSYAGSAGKKSVKSSPVNKSRLAGNKGSNSGILSGAIAQGGQFLGGTVDQIDSKNGRSDTGQALSGGLKGAGTGASIGTMIAPGIGTAIGAGVGAVAGAVTSPTPSEQFNWSEQDIAAARKHRGAAKANKNAPSAGVADDNSARFFEKGGDFTKYMVPEAEKGGSVKQLSDNVRKFEGQTHEEGGIKVDVNKDPNADIEVEDDEVQFQDKIFSDSLYVKEEGKNKKGKKKKSFADKATEIGKKLDKYEKKIDNQPHNNEAQNTAELMTERLNKDLIELFVQQELQKQKKGIKTG